MNSTLIIDNITTLTTSQPELTLCVDSVISSPVKVIITLSVIAIIFFYMISRTSYEKLEYVTRENATEKIINHFKKNRDHYILFIGLAISIGLLVNVIYFTLFF